MNSIKFVRDIEVGGTCNTHLKVKRIWKLSDTYRILVVTFEGKRQRGWRKILSDNNLMNRYLDWIKVGFGGGNLWTWWLIKIKDFWYIATRRLISTDVSKESVFSSRRRLTFRHRASSVWYMRFSALQRTLFIYLINKYISLSDIYLAVHHWYK